MKRSSLYRTALSILGSLLLCAGLASAQDYTKTPVFFVHGHGMNGSSWADMISYLAARDYPGLYLRTIDLVPADGANIAAAELQIAPAVESFLADVNAYLQANYPSVPQKTKVDVISHSMGSVSSRWYTAKVRPDRVRKWVSLAGANHGSDAGCSLSGVGADDVCPAYAQNAQQSEVQYSLNGAPYAADVDETPYGIGLDATGVTSVAPDATRRILYMTLRTNQDLWIVPLGSTVVDGAGGVDVSIPPGVQASVTTPGNILMQNGIDHDTILTDDDTGSVIKSILDVNVACGYVLSAASNAFPTSASGSASVTVTAGARCPWTAASNAAWITISSGASGSGNGTVSYGVTESTAAMRRTGTITIAGQTYTVTQEGASTPAPAPAPDPTPAAASGGGGGCFIATAAFGSTDEPHVQTLRDFRDSVLLGTPIGSEFVSFYYRVSPPIADFIAEHETLKTAVRLGLVPVVYAVKHPSAALGMMLLIPAAVIVRKRCFPLCRLRPLRGAAPLLPLPLRGTLPSLLRPAQQEEDRRHEQKG